MKPAHKFKYFLLFSLALSSLLNASDEGTTGAPVLKIPVGARTLAMGGATTAISNGAEALYGNPAGLNWAERPALMFTYNPIVEGASYNQAAVSFKTRRMGFGIGYNGLSQDAIDSYDGVGNRLTSYTASDQMTALGFAFGKKSASLGVATKFIRSSIDGVSASAWASDIGLGFSNPWTGTMTHALVAKNLGGKVSFITQEDALPTRFVLGNAVTIKKLVLTLDGGTQEGTDGFASGGAEWSIFSSENRALALRAGYTTLRNEIDELSGASFGIGLLLKHFSLDYSWIPYGALGNSQAVTLVWRIPKLVGQGKKTSAIRSSKEPETRDEKIERMNIDTTSWQTFSLDNGKQIDGQITKETKSHYQISSENGKVSIKKASVTKIEKFQPGRKKRLGNMD